MTIWDFKSSQDEAIDDTWLCRTAAAHFFRTHCANFMIELPNAYAARKDELHLEFAMSRCTVGKTELF